MTTEERAVDYLEKPPKYPGEDRAIPIIEDLLRLYRLEKNRAQSVQKRYDELSVEILAMAARE